MDTFFSIIVIAHNEEKRLSRCLDSLIAQSFRGIEIICVDDGSTDHTADIMDEYASRDSRIVVVRQPRNMGMAAARCAGFNKSQSQWIMFVDSDDTLLPHACEKLHNLLFTQPVDVLEYGVQAVPDEAAPPDAALLRTMQAYFDKPEGSFSDTAALMKAAYTDKSITWNAVHKVYARGVLSKAYADFHNEYINMWEDLWLSFIVFGQVSGYRCIAEKLYICYIGCGMSTDAAVSTKRVLANVHDYKQVSTLINCASEGHPSAVFVPELKKEMASTLLDAIFRRCTPEQAKELLPDVLSCFTKEEFGQYACGYVGTHMRTTEKCLKETQDYLDGVLHSPTWRIGNAITALPKKLRNLLRREG